MQQKGGINMTAPILQEETYQEKLEIEEMPDGTWQVREIKIFTYKNPLAARNKMEKYIYRHKSE